MKIAGSHRHWRTHMGPTSHTKLHDPHGEPRRMTDSFSRLCIPISKPEIRERYVNSLNQIRMGRLLEDMDTLAYYIGYKHNNLVHEENVEDSLAKRAAFSIVTASIDRILIEHRPLPNADIHLSGHISWVGNASMEATMFIDQFDEEDKLRRVMKANMVLVALDPQLKTGTPVSPLLHDTAEEQSIFMEGEKNREKRMVVSQQSLMRSPPNAEESTLIHDLYLQTLDPSCHSFQGRYKPSNDVWMKDTSMKSLVICHPQKRNIHGNVYAGFLIRAALELAWAECWAFSRSKPYLLAVEDMIFRKPVRIGSLIWLHMSIGYTDGDLLQTRVTAEVSDPNDPSYRELTNVFHFLFRAPLKSGRGVLPRIFPNTYGESMLFLDSRRRILDIKDQLGTQADRKLDLDHHHPHRH